MFILSPSIEAEKRTKRNRERSGRKALKTLFVGFKFIDNNRGENNYGARRGRLMSYETLYESIIFNRKLLADCVFPFKRMIALWARTCSLSAIANYAITPLMERRNHYFVCWFALGGIPRRKLFALSHNHQISVEAIRTVSFCNFFSFFGESRKVLGGNKDISSRSIEADPLRRRLQSGESRSFGANIFSWNFLAQIIWYHWNCDAIDNIADQKLRFPLKHFVRRSTIGVSYYFSL